MLNFNVSGKCAVDVAASIKKSVNLLKEIVPGFEILGLTADSGSGWAGPGIFKILMDNGVFPPFARLIRCLMHALNMMLQKAMDTTLGSQGLKNDLSMHSAL